MTFTCVVCQRNQPIDLGKPMRSGSWICTDADDCARVMVENIAAVKAAAAELGFLL